MTKLDIFLVVLVVLLGVTLVLAAVIAIRVMQRSLKASSQFTIDAMRAERSVAFKETFDTVLSVASSKLGDQLDAGKNVIEREVAHLDSRLGQIGEMMGSLARERAEQMGRFESGLEKQLAATGALTVEARSLRDVLASPKARGQWGERMAEDVLRSAGFKEGVNYRRQTKLKSGGIPDFTFLLPWNRVLNMDVKFPVDNYQRWLEADHDMAREGAAKSFRKDVRNRVKELAVRDYVDPSSTVDYVLLFVPNESVYGFAHEQDPDLLDFALGQKVVLCSPSTLFAMLAIIWQSMDQYLVEQKSREILDALVELRVEWTRWCESMTTLGKHLEKVQNTYDDLSQKRTRKFDKSLKNLENFRAAEEEICDSDNGVRNKPLGLVTPLSEGLG